MATDKKPGRGILKHTSSFDNPDLHPSQKEMKWDEMNIMATHHPPGKEYGHMKIDEPPTPYSKYSDPEDDEEGERRNSLGVVDEMDPMSLASRLLATGPRAEQEDIEESSEEEEAEELTEEEREKKLKFEQKRKIHYNEFHAIKLAKQLMAEEDEDEDDDTGTDSRTSGSGAEK